MFPDPTVVSCVFVTMVVRGGAKSYCASLHRTANPSKWAIHAANSSAWMTICTTTTKGDRIWVSD